jgi:hypothetical protein
LEEAAVWKDGGCFLRLKQVAKEVTSCLRIGDFGVRGSRQFQQFFGSAKNRCRYDGGWITRRKSVLADVIGVVVIQLVRDVRTCERRNCSTLIADFVRSTNMSSLEFVKLTSATSMKR